MKNIHILFLCLQLIVLSCNDDAVVKNNTPPTCAILTPIDGASIVRGTMLTIIIILNDTDGIVVNAMITIGNFSDNLAVTDTVMYDFYTENLDLEQYIIKVTVEDNNGKITTDEVLINIEEEKEGELYDDRDDQIYKTIKIGNQWWMAENLNFSTDSNSWIYDNNSSNAYIYGRLYNWEIANQVCPSDWHLPDNDEWFELISFLGGFDVAGGLMKVQDSTYWDSPNLGATDSSGFSGLAAGSYNQNSFDGMKQFAFFWASNEMFFTDHYSGLFFRLDYNREAIETYYTNKNYGFSVRCVKDY